MVRKGSLKTRNTWYWLPVTMVMKLTNFPLT